MKTLFIAMYNDFRAPEYSVGEHQILCHNQLAKMTPEQLPSKVRIAGQHSTATWLDSVPEELNGKVYMEADIIKVEQVGPANMRRSYLTLTNFKEIEQSVADNEIMNYLYNAPIICDI